MELHDDKRFLIKIQAFKLSLNAIKSKKTAFTRFYDSLVNFENLFYNSLILPPQNENSKEIVKSAVENTTSLFSDISNDVINSDLLTITLSISKILNLDEIVMFYLACVSKLKKKSLDMEFDEQIIFNYYNSLHEASKLIIEMCDVPFSEENFFTNKEYIKYTEFLQNAKHFIRNFFIYKSKSKDQILHLVDGGILKKRSFTDNIMEIDCKIMKNLASVMLTLTCLDTTTINYDVPLFLDFISNNGNMTIENLNNEYKNELYVSCISLFCILRIYKNLARYKELDNPDANIYFYPNAAQIYKYITDSHLCDPFKSVILTCFGLAVIVNANSSSLELFPKLFETSTEWINSSIHNTLFKDIWKIIESNLFDEIVSPSVEQLVHFIIIEILSFYPSEIKILAIKSHKELNGEHNTVQNIHDDSFMNFNYLADILLILYRNRKFPELINDYWVFDCNKYPYIEEHQWENVYNFIASIAVNTTDQFFYYLKLLKCISITELACSACFRFLQANKNSITSFNHFCQSLENYQEHMIKMELFVGKEAHHNLTNGVEAELMTLSILESETLALFHILSTLANLTYYSSDVRLAIIGNESYSPSDAIINLIRMDLHFSLKSELVKILTNISRHESKFAYCVLNAFIQHEHISADGHSSIFSQFNVLSDYGSVVEFYLNFVKLLRVLLMTCGITENIGNFNIVLPLFQFIKNFIFEESVPSLNLNQIKMDTNYINGSLNCSAYECLVTFISFYNPKRDKSFNDANPGFLLYKDFLNDSPLFNRILENFKDNAGKCFSFFNNSSNFHLKTLLIQLKLIHYAIDNILHFSNHFSHGTKNELILQSNSFIKNNDKMVCIVESLIPFISYGLKLPYHAWMAINILQLLCRDVFNIEKLNFLLVSQEKTKEMIKYGIMQCIELIPGTMESVSSIETFESIQNLNLPPSKMVYDELRDKLFILFIENVGKHKFGFVHQFLGYQRSNGVEKYNARLVVSNSRNCLHSILHLFSKGYLNMSNNGYNVHSYALLLLNSLTCDKLTSDCTLDFINDKFSFITQLIKFMNLDVDFKTRTENCLINHPHAHFSHLYQSSKILEIYIVQFHKLLQDGLDATAMEFQQIFFNVRANSSLEDFTCSIFHNLLKYVLYDITNIPIKPTSLEKSTTLETLFAFQIPNNNIQFISANQNYSKLIRNNVENLKLLDHEFQCDEDTMDNYCNYVTKLYNYKKRLYAEIQYAQSLSNLICYLFKFSCNYCNFQHIDHYLIESVLIMTKKISHRCVPVDVKQILTKCILFLIHVYKEYYFKLQNITINRDSTHWGSAVVTRSQSSPYQVIASLKSLLDFIKISERFGDGNSLSRCSIYSAIISWLDILFESARINTCYSSIVCRQYLLNEAKHVLEMDFIKLISILISDVVDGVFSTKLIALNLFEKLISIDENSVWIKEVLNSGFLEIKSTEIFSCDLQLSDIATFPSNCLDEGYTKTVENIERKLEQYESVMSLFSNISLKSIGAYHFRDFYFVSKLISYVIYQQQGCEELLNVIYEEKLDPSALKIHECYYRLIIPAIRFICIVFSIIKSTELYKQIKYFISKNLLVFEKIIGRFVMSTDDNSCADCNLILNILTLMKVESIPKNDDWSEFDILKIKSMMINLFCTVTYMKDDSFEKLPNINEIFLCIVKCIRMLVVSDTNVLQSSGENILFLPSFYEVISVNFSRDSQPLKIENINIGCLVLSLDSIMKHLKSKLKRFNKIKDIINRHSIEKSSKCVIDVNEIFPKLTFSPTLSVTEINDYIMNLLNEAFKISENELNIKLCTFDNLTFLLYIHCRYYLFKYAAMLTNEMEHVNLDYKSHHGDTESNQIWDKSMIDKSCLKKFRHELDFIKRNGFFSRLETTCQDYAIYKPNNLSLTILHRLKQFV